MPSKDPRVDAYIARSADFARPILTRLRRVVHAGCPDVTETIKWGVPSFEYQGPMCGMAAFKSHCMFGLWKAPLLAERVPGMPAAAHAAGPFRRITSLAELPDEKTLVRIVKEAARLNADGVKVPRTRLAPKAPVRLPPVLVAALRKNRKAQAAFDAFSPSHRREYVEWIADAKTDETRRRRVAQAIEWIAEGKSRNWKYERR
jgi:uncharacterized protein YdeI (YjbR/CyaY-like superfamily)